MSLVASFDDFLRRTVAGCSPYVNPAVFVGLRVGNVGQFPVVLISLCLCRLPLGDRLDRGVVAHYTLLTAEDGVFRPLGGSLIHPAYRSYPRGPHDYPNNAPGEFHKRLAAGDTTGAPCNGTGAAAPTTWVKGQPVGIGERDR